MSSSAVKRVEFMVAVAATLITFALVVTVILMA
jgi:hypothetical protein